MALAEDPALNVPKTTSDSGANYQPQQLQLFDSSVIENTKVTDKDGKHLGKLERLLIDSLTGRVRFVIIEVDKEWSLNNPEVIIPWSTLQIAPQGDKNYTVRIDATRDKLMSAPNFDKALVQQLTTREAGQPIYAYWGVTWQDEMDRSATAQTPTSLPSTTTPGAEPNLNSTSPTSSTPSTASTPSTSPSPTTSTGPGVPSALPPPVPGTPPAPITATDGSATNQSLGNSGTSDSPRPDSKLGQPAPKDPATTPPNESDLSTDPDRSRGGNETD